MRNTVGAKQLSSDFGAQRTIYKAFIHMIRIIACLFSMVSNTAIPTDHKNEDVTL